MPEPYYRPVYTCPSCGKAELQLSRRHLNTHYAVHPMQYRNGDVLYCRECDFVFSTTNKGQMPAQLSDLLSNFNEVYPPREKRTLVVAFEQQLVIALPKNLPWWQVVVGIYLAKCAARILRSSLQPQEVPCADSN